MYFSLFYVLVYNAVIEKKKQKKTKNKKFNKLILANGFENFRKMYLELFELDPAKFLSAPGLAWPAALIKTEIKLELLTDINMLLMVEKRIREGIFPTIHRYTKANKK